MADLVPANFRQPTGPVNVNFDFSDYLETTGYINFYGITDTASSYYLSRQQVESSTVYTEVNANPDATVTLEVNFDYEFLAPQLVKGKLYVVATYAAKAVGGASSATTKITFRPLHYDGTTETQMAAAQTTDDVASGLGTTNYAVDTVVFDVNQFFKPSDKLRIEAILKFTSSNNTNNSCRLYHDGANRNLSITDSKSGAAADSNLKIVVPFKIDS